MFFPVGASITASTALAAGSVVITGAEFREEEPSTRVEDPSTRVEDPPTAPAAGAP